MKPGTRRIASLLAMLCGACAAGARESRHDVVVYGGTPAGITAAIAAAREGASVVLLEQTRHVGGLSTSGLNRDESEHMYRSETFGGLCDRFIRAASRRSGFTHRGRGAYVWQSHVAERVFLEMLEDARVKTLFGQLIEDVSREGDRVASLTVRGGRAFRANVYIDATYEGDLLAKAGVSYVTGRESRDEFGESMAGVIYPDRPIKASPYDRDGRLLPWVMSGPPPEAGAASSHPTCYNIRLNLTTRPGNRVPITKPDDYDPKQHELLARCIEAGMIRDIRQIIGLYGMPDGKAECNNRQTSIVSMSIPGAQTPWSEATFEEREAIHRAYRSYTHGMLWFLQSDARVPEAMRRSMARYGLCRDEWTDNEHWPWYLYVREGRRMRGEYVITQADIINRRTKEDVVHLCSHWIDSHQPTRYAVDAHSFVNEGRLWQRGKIYQFPYRALTPKRAECANLLVPVCVSASHVAFCSIRLEPTWMHLGEASGIAASMAATSGRAVQDLDVAQLQARLRAAGIPLDMPATATRSPSRRHPEGGAEWVDAFFRQTDIDRDGKVSRPEWLRTKAEYDWLFDIIDKGRDGRIDRAEYVEFQEYKKTRPDWRTRLRRRTE
ncbi:MAG: FAD-dependent oxidoreductase [Planctomycetota bacterium]|jgi:hypothetical protein